MTASQLQEIKRALHMVEQRNKFGHKAMFEYLDRVEAHLLKALEIQEA